MNVSRPLDAAPLTTWRASRARVRDSLQPAWALTPSATRLVFVAAAMLAVTLVLGLGRSLSFNGDEWAYIVMRHLTIESMLQPHNEHLVFFHVLVYRGLVEVVGIGSYLPFLVVLMACHVAMAAGVYVLLRKTVSVGAALGAAVLLLFLGSGFDNLLWAFQIGFVGAAALGVWALVAADRPAVCAVLLTLAVWTHGDALFFLPPAALLIARRRWLLLPIASYVAWFVAIGRGPVPIPSLDALIDYGARLTGSIVGGAAGFGPLAGLLIVALIGVGLVVERSAPSRVVLAGLLGLAATVAILTFGRAYLGPEQAEAPRYVYVAFPFVMLVLTGVRRVPRLAWAALFALALALNVWALPRGVAIYQAFLSFDRSQTMEERLAPFVQPAAPPRP